MSYHRLSIVFVETGDSSWPALELLSGISLVSPQSGPAAAWTFVLKALQLVAPSGCQHGQGVEEPSSSRLPFCEFRNEATGAEKPGIVIRVTKFDHRIPVLAH
jgi:hypothetical protein